jgi:hypothetical protein
MRIVVDHLICVVAGCPFPEARQPPFQIDLPLVQRIWMGMYGIHVALRFHPGHGVGREVLADGQITHREDVRTETAGHFSKSLS